MKRRRIWRKLRYPFTTLGARLALGAVACLRYRQVERLAGFLAFWIGCLPSARRLVCGNLRVAFPEWPEDKVRDVGRQSIRHTCLTLLEFAWFSSHPGRIREAVVYGSDESRQLIQRVIAENIPLLVMTPHLGNWELSAQFACSAGMKLCAVARGMHNPGLNRLLLDSRSHSGLEIIDRGGAVKGIVKALKDGKAVGVLMDQNTRPRKGGIFVDFFGLPVPTTRAPASLARKLDVDCPCFACIRKAGRFELHIKRLPKPVGAYRDDIELTAAMLKLNEDFAREYPEQYLWLYERWRYIPDGTAPEAAGGYPYYAKPAKRSASG